MYWDQKIWTLDISSLLQCCESGQSEAGRYVLTRRTKETDTKVKCEGLAGIVSLVIEGIELVDQETDVEGEDPDDPCH